MATKKRGASKQSKDAEAPMVKLTATATAPMPEPMRAGLEFEAPADEALVYVMNRTARYGWASDGDEDVPGRAAAAKTRAPRKTRAKKAAGTKAAEVTVAEQKEIARVAKEEAAAEKAAEGKASAEETKA